MSGWSKKILPAILGSFLFPGLLSAEALSDDTVLLLGTGAGEGMPSFFCKCAFCEKVRRAGGHNYRYRTAFQLGETIRIDWGPDGAAQTWDFNLPAWKLRHLFFTHSHEDHLWAGDFWVRAASSMPPGSELKVYGNRETLKIISDAIGGNWKRHSMIPVEIKPGDLVKVPELDLEVKVLHANHTAPEKSMMFHFKNPRWQILFTGDTGKFMDSAWGELAGAKLNLILADATWGMEEPGGSHFGFAGVAEMQKEIRRRNMAAENLQTVTVHMAHTAGALLHEEMEKVLPVKFNLIPGFDGMTVKPETGKISGISKR